MLRWRIQAVKYARMPMTRSNWHFQVFEPTVGVAEWPSSQYMVWNFSKLAIHKFLVWLQPISLLHQIFSNITFNSFLLQPIAQKTYGFDGDQEKLAQNLLNIKVMRYKQRLWQIVTNYKVYLTNSPQGVFQDTQPEAGDREQNIRLGGKCHTQISKNNEHLLTHCKTL